MKKQFTELIGVCCTAILLLLITSTGAQAQYCIPGPSSNGSEWLAGVEFAGIENLTPTAPASSYTDFTDQVGVVVPGVTYEFIGTIGMPTTSSWTETITVFIDFNQDEVFDNVTERFDIGTSCNSNGCQLIDDILIPLDAIPGVTTMRVMQNYFSPIIDPCVSQGFTETEDYGLLIGGDCVPPTVAFDIQDDCELLTYDVKATWEDLGSVVDVPNQDVTVFLTRSDIGDAGFIVVPIFLVGLPDLDVILDVPFGVTVTASIEAGSDPDCYITRTWNENGLCPPANNDCETAQAIACDDVLEGSTINGSVNPEGLELCNGFNTPSPSVWYVYEHTLENPAFITAGLNPTFDAQHFIYSGSCDALDCIDGSDFGDIVFAALPGETYYILVTGWGGASGDFSIDLSCEEILCGFPDVTATAVDADGVALEGCVDFGDTYRVEVTIEGGSGNDTYSVSVGDSTIVLSSPATHIFGDYAPGANVNVSVNGDQDGNCDQSLTVNVPVCPPANDLCIDAFEATCDGSPYAGTTIGATAAEGQLYCGTTAPAATNGGVWYVWTLDGTFDVDVDLSGSLYDTKLFLYSGTCDELTCVAGNDDGGDGLDSRIQTTLGSGTYYIYISGFGANSGEYLMNISCVELLCNAPTATVTAVDDEGVAIDGCLPFGETHRVLVDLTGGEGNDTYSVVVGDSTFVLASPGSHIFGDYVVGSNVVVAVNGDQDPACDFTTSVTVPVCPAENDLCADALEAVCGGQYSGSTIGATMAAGQEYCGTTAPSNGGVWYSFSLDGQADLDIDLSGSLYDTKLFLYSGTCDGLVCEDGDDDGGDGLDSRIQGSFPAGDYYIYIAGFGAAQGTYLMNISCIDVTCSPELTVTAVDIDGNELTDCVDQTGEYYVLVAVAGGANNDFYDINVNGFSLGQVPADGSVVVGPVSATATANVSVTGATQNTCSASASTSAIICPPSNDFPCDAIPIATDGVGGIYTNVNSTADAGEPAPIFGNNQSVWFTFEGPASGRVNLSLCSPNTDFDTGLILYEVEECGDYATYTQVALNDDNFAACGTFGPSELETCVAPGTTYYVSVVGWNTNVGNFEITATEVDGAVCLCDLPDFGPEVFTFADTAPICDDPENPAFSLTFYSWTDMGSSTGFIYTYAFDGGEPIELILLEGEDPVTVPETFPLGTIVTVTVDINDPNCTGADGSIYPLTGNITQDEFACDPDCEGVPGGTAEPGTPCVLDDLPGVWDVNCECVPTPVNDLCGDAISVSCGDVIEGTTVASSVIDVPAFCGTTPGTGGGVWYSITGTGGEITASLCGSAYDTKINVYEGSCDALVCVTGIDDFCGLQSEVSWESQEGVEYLMYVNGFAANVGAFTLTMTCEAVSTTSINGTVDGWPGTCGDRNVDVDLYTPDTDVLIGTYSGVVDAAGNFTIADLPTGTYDVIAKVDGTLAKGFADFVIVAGVNDLAVGTVQRGDVNNDNGINIIDFSLINASFNSVDGDANYNPLADLNCSGGVNILDVSILSPNFLATGATAPLD